MSIHRTQSLNATIASLRSAADHLDEVRNRAPEHVDQAVVDTQSCCGTCTLVSFVPPCKNACIKVSPLF